jgi:hypothetical protein
LNRAAVNAGRYKALRRLALPAFDSRVRFFTLVPLRYSRGASPADAAACCADANRLGSGNSARMALAATGPTPGIVRSSVGLVLQAVGLLRQEGGGAGERLPLGGR